jgi:RNA polymerase sigma factor (sigma-70 family)
MSAAFDTPVSPGDLDDARAGGRRGMEAIYRAFERPVFTLARRMAGCPDAAQDIVQNTFLRAFRSLAQYRGEAPFGHWLRSIAATESLMHLRQGRRWLELFVPQEDYVEELIGNVDVSTVDLERSLALLPPVPRAVLWLYHVEGYTHLEIGELCGKTPSFSKSQLSRAHQKLRQLLGVGSAVAAPEAASSATKPPPASPKVQARVMELLP